MPAPCKILIMGASYGSLLATKLLLAGHTVQLVCLPAEAELINTEGVRVRMPVKGRDGLVEIDSRKLPGKLSAGGTEGVNPGDYDLVALAMQEPQYRSPGVRELLDAVAKAKVPCMSIMNMPPLPYLKRIPGLNADACRDCYTDATVWDSFDPALHDAVQPRPAGVPPAGREGQRAAGAAADQLQGGALRVGRAHRDPAPARVGHRRGALRRRRRQQDRAAGEAQGARLDLRAAREVGDAARRQLSLRAEGRHALDQGRRAQRPRGVARGLRLGGRRCACRSARPRRTSCRSRSTPTRRCRCGARPPRRARWPPARPTSSASTAWCRPSRKQKGMRNAVVDQTVALVDGWLEKNRKKA